MPRPTALDRRSMLALATASLVAVSVLASCNDDGRTMRPARPDQDASVSTTAPPTDPPIPVGEEIGADVDDGLDDGLGAFTTVGVPSTVAGGGGVATTVAAFPTAAVLPAPWEDGGAIDPRYTCDGENVSPALTWTAPPEGTVEIAIAVTDDDAPEVVLWTLAALDPLSTALGEGRVPEFAIQGVNSDAVLGYSGPCPPEGEVHTYRFTVFFLGQQTELPDGSPGVDLLGAMRASAFDSASVTGTYG